MPGSVFERQLRHSLDTDPGDCTPTLADFLGMSESKEFGCKLSLCSSSWPCGAVPGAQVARLFRGPPLCLRPRVEPLETRPQAGVDILLLSPPFIDMREPSRGFSSGLHNTQASSQLMNVCCWMPEHRPGPSCRAARACAWAWGHHMEAFLVSSGCR